MTSDSCSIISSLKMDSIKEENLADASFDDEFAIMAELAMAEFDMAEPNNTSSSSSPDDSKDSSIMDGPHNNNSSSSSPSPPHHQETSPDDSEEMIQFPAFTDHHCNETILDNEVLSEDSTSIKSHASSVWEQAGVPLSYYDNSDPDAETPINNKGGVYDDALIATGDSYLADANNEEEEEEDDHLDKINEQLLLPTLNNLPTTHLNAATTHHYCRDEDVNRREEEGEEVDLNGDEGQECISVL
jgi:hypothetical protein